MKAPDPVTVSSITTWYRLWGQLFHVESGEDEAEGVRSRKSGITPDPLC